MKFLMLTILVLHGSHKTETSSFEYATRQYCELAAVAAKGHYSTFDVYTLCVENPEAKK